MQGNLLYFRVEDDAMSGDRISKGDMVIIRVQNEMREGSVSLVIAGSRFLLRRIKQQEDHYILASSNPIFNKIIVNDIHVIGTLVFNCIRTLK